jgi:hexokinase
VIKELEDIFTVDQQKLKKITDHFVKELEKGISLSALYRVVLTIRCRVE